MALSWKASYVRTSSSAMTRCFVFLPFIPKKYPTLRMGVSNLPFLRGFVASLASSQFTSIKSPNCRFLVICGISLFTLQSLNGEKEFSVVKGDCVECCCYCWL